MNLLDVRTVIFSYTISNFICMVVITILFLQNRYRFAGLGFWLADFVLQFTGLVLVVLRNSLPDFFWTVSNAMIIGGTILLYMGLERFTGKRTRQVHNYVLLAVFIVVHVYFIYFYPNLTIRNILISLGLLGVCVQCAWLTLRRVEPEVRPITRSIGLVFIGFCLVSAGRVIVDLLVPQEIDFFHSNTYETLLLVMYQMLFIALTFSLFLLVNRNLIFNLSQDITVRKRVENTLTERLKELQCVYDLSNLIDSPGATLVGILYGSVKLLPLAVQHPELACARLIIEGQEYATGNYQESTRKTACNIKVNGRSIGALEVCYLDESPVNIDLNFLAEEDKLLQDIARRLGQVIERKQADDALKQSEEKFFKAFQASPDAILISRLSDGQLIEVNEGFCRLSGYTREEALANSSINLALWLSLQDRERVVTELQKNYKIRNYEADFRVKSGGILNGLYSGEIIQLGSETHIFSVIRDITERKQIEAALQESEAHFREVFDNTAHGTFIIEVTEECDFRIGDSNKAEEILTTIRREDVMGKMVKDAFPPEIAQALHDNYSRCLEAGVSITYEEEVNLPGVGRRAYLTTLAPVRDDTGRIYRIIGSTLEITASKQAEEIRRLRLSLWEYASTHPLEELMQKALDEICKLTDSPIGFYHFVEKDQNTISLQAWSTRTLAEFCTVEGMDLHYPIDEAGVWADCIRERKPVIHNDYASLPHRKGMPVGHAEVIRQLVVPTLRNNQIVTILGIGNRPTNYDENDSELVSYFADIIWTIIDQKRSSEQILLLNGKLEQLAMTDELTGLFNRRSFFKRGTEEIRRSQRYHNSLSLLMMDIDDFKTINDTYGHDAGDHMLRCVADTLQHHIRDVDVLGRLGGARGESHGVLI